MKFADFYPINFKLLDDRKELVYNVFRAVEPHKGGFISVCRLDGSFLCDDCESLFASLRTGEPLSVVMCDNKGKHICRPLEVKRKNGEVIGTLPYTESIIPNLLAARGINVTAYLEIKEFSSDILNLAVSVYSEKY